MASAGQDKTFYQISPSLNQLIIQAHILVLNWPRIQAFLDHLKVKPCVRNTKRLKDNLMSQ